MKSLKTALPKLKQEAKSLAESVIGDSAENPNGEDVVFNRDDRVIVGEDAGESVDPDLRSVLHSDLNGQEHLSDQDSDSEQDSEIIEAERLVDQDPAFVTFVNHLAYLLDYIPINELQKIFLFCTQTSSRNYEFFKPARQMIYERNYIPRVLRLEGTHFEDRVTMERFQQLERLAMRPNAENRLQPTDSMTRDRNALIALCETYEGYFQEYINEFTEWDNSHFTLWPAPNAQNFDQSSLIAVKEGIPAFRSFGHTLFHLLDKTIAYCNELREYLRRGADDENELNSLGNEIWQSQAALNAVIESLCRDGNLQGPSRRESCAWLSGFLRDRPIGLFLVNFDCSVSTSLGEVPMLATIENAVSLISNLKQELRRDKAVITALDRDSQPQDRVFKPS